MPTFTALGTAQNGIAGRLGIRHYRASRSQWHRPSSDVRL
jgi:hypothetical protein